MHITVHVLYFSLTLVAQRWCVQQNVQRIQVGQMAVLQGCTHAIKTVLWMTVSICALLLLMKVVAFTALKELTSQSVVFAANLLALITMFRYVIGFLGR